MATDLASKPRFVTTDGVTVFNPDLIADSVERYQAAARREASEARSDQAMLKRMPQVFQSVDELWLADVLRAYRKAAPEWKAMVSKMGRSAVVVLVTPECDRPAGQAEDVRLRFEANDVARETTGKICNAETREIARIALREHDMENEILMILQRGPRQADIGVFWLPFVDLAEAECGMADETSVPAPHADHVNLLMQVAPRLETQLRSIGRGLAVLQIAEGGNGEYRSGFTPAQHVTVEHITAMGVPEPQAKEIRETVKTYDSLVGAPVLITEGLPKAGMPYSFIMLDVRPLPPKGSTETKH